MWILSFIKNIKLVPFLIGVILMLSLVGYWQYDRARTFESERNRQKENYESVITSKDNKLTKLRLKGQAELDYYLDSNKKLSSLVDSLKIKTKQIKTITLYEEVYIDTTTTKVDVSPIIHGIVKNIPTVSPWRDSTKCLELDGLVIYRDGKLSVEVTNRVYKNDISITAHWYRNPKNLITRMFGKKIYTVKTITRCGDGQTTVIDIDKQ